MTLDKIIRIQNQLQLDYVTPLVLDYNIIKSDLYDKGYREEKLESLSLTKLKSMYMEKILK
jgi:hypothetical protein